MSTVLVTGGSGFVGTYIILQLLEAGYVVRTTVRSLQREAGVAVAATTESLVKLGIVSSSG
jgi:nucleoside-diphosphate-sugar epimerase